MNSSMYLVLIESCCFYERQHDSTEFNRLVRKTEHSAQNLFFTGTVRTKVRGRDLLGNSDQLQEQK